MVTEVPPRVVEVRVCGGTTELLTTVQVSPFLRSPTVLPSAPQPNAEVNDTGVKRGREEMGSPPSGASMIHSTLLPLKVAPGGGTSVTVMVCPVVWLAKLIWPATPLIYCTEQWTVSPGLTEKFEILVWKTYAGAGS